ncbi:GNAT family N-acetyltransferase [Robiginitalea aurantiaca]|uniref:GNAT family N-acetyltransferase n=1 Tax=Robiginitalea aurantiaca TaxID=3056915 RepID=A0ABT7WBL5_9FLAO|nr:GNAT family N-acetyltransferase [Robiginitalea aurantiaca]MDM9630298.1 GNAT family N-acetyltransferase [Robiginitalea aurantiaca]
MEELNVYEISSSEAVDQYKDILKAVGNNWPYLRYELINVGILEDSQLMYFVYSVNEEPLVLMPFYKRRISIGNQRTAYFDVISPWGYAGPIFKEAIEEKVATAFWRLADDWYRDNNIVSEFIRFHFQGNHLCYSGSVAHTLYNVRGVIREKEVIWDNLQSKTKNKVRNAYKNNLRFSMFHGSISPKQVSEFYEIYISTMDRNDAAESFYHDLAYFQEFVKNNSDGCTIGMVYKDGRAISTELFLISEDTVFSYFGGTLGEFFKLRPNDFLKMEAINWMYLNGFKYYVIGGGLKEHDSLYQYKKKFFRFDEDPSFLSGRKIVNLEVYRELVGMALPEIPISEITLDSASTGFFPKYRSKRNR